MLKFSALVILVLSACGGSAPAPTTPSAPVPMPVGEQEDQAKTVIGELTSLEQGDVACYIVLDVDDKELRYPGPFSYCEGGFEDASELLGSRVQITLEQGELEANSCAGDPDCTDVEITELVTAIEPR